VRGRERRQRRRASFRRQGRRHSSGTSTARRRIGWSLHRQRAAYRLEEDDDQRKLGRASARPQFAARAADREERRKTWAEFGPGEKERRKGTPFFYPQVFSIFVLQIYFAVLVTI
jgi:hypothetical protein